MPRKLKVYRTAIGFHDAYVAAPSMKAALEAWGTDKDLFARKAAEVVEDPKLAAPALARPGEVIRVLRGSASEHVKALGKVAKPKAKAPPEPRVDPGSPAKPPRPKRPPKPSREFVKLAEHALRAGEERARERVAELARREKELAAERRRLEQELADERERHEARVSRAQNSYAAELAAWNAWGRA